MHVKAVHTSIFQKNDDIFSFIINHVPRLNERDIIVITSKIVSLSEGVVIPKAQKRKFLESISTKMIETPWAILTCIDDEWTINAGVDESNAKQGLIVLPNDSHKTAHILLTKLKKSFKLKQCGVLITDTRSIPLRVGTVGRAIGYAGFKPCKSYIGKEDLFKRKSRVTISNHADALAGVAVLTMGEGNEQTPLAVISDAPVTFTNQKMNIRDKHMHISPDADIFSYIFKEDDVE